MTINTIQTPVTGYESQRLEQLDQQRLENAKSKTATETSSQDRISISEEGRLKAAMLNGAQESDGVRQDKVAEFKAQIATGQYKVDSKDVAASLVRQELDVWG